MSILNMNIDNNMIAIHANYLLVSKRLIFIYDGVEIGDFS